jgi:hypothetical protein
MPSTPKLQQGPTSGLGQHRLMKSESRWPAEVAAWLDGRAGGAGTNVRRPEKRREAAWIRGAAATEECLVFSDLTRNRKPNGNPTVPI